MQTEKKYSCDACSYRTKWTSTLARHRKRHLKDAGLKCELCPTVKLYCKFDRDEHNRTVHGEGLICSVCSKRFTTRSGLYEHMQKERGLFRYQCEICLKQFRVKSHLDGHMNKHTGFKPYECEKCKKSFNYGSALYRHQKICRKETKEKDKKDEYIFKCDQCNHVLSTSVILKAHKSEIHGNNVFRCKVCDKTYQWAASYYRHIKTHSIS